MGFADGERDGLGVGAREGNAVGCGVGAAEGGQAQPLGGLHTGSTQQISERQYLRVVESMHLLLPFGPLRKVGAVAGVKMFSIEGAAVGAALGFGVVANNAGPVLLDTSIHKHARKVQLERLKDREATIIII